MAPSNKFFPLGSGAENELLDQIPLGLLIISGDFKVAYWNSWMEESTQVRREDVLGRVITDVYPNLKDPRYLDRIDGVLKGAPPTIFSSLLHGHTIPIKQRNGEYKIQNTTVIPFQSQSGETFALFAIHDVTDLTNRISESRAMRDEAVRLKNQAEEATRLKDKFVSLVSHDLKNPLTSIFGFLQIIKDDFDDLSKDDVMFMVRSAIESVNNMSRLIDDILSISRIKGGKMALAPQFFNISTLAKKTTANLRPMAEKKMIEINVQFPEKARAFGDPVFLELVIQNLVGNSIKFCNAGNKISVFSPPGEPSTICVEDDGIGIQFPNIEDVFRHEKKTSLPGTAGETGTGFGLPLSRDIVEAHGGTLTAQSEVGKGSAFFIRLPEVKPLVLIVDDDKLARDMIKARLLPLDVKTIEATNGRDAIETINRHKPDLVITDILMPDSDGYQLIKNIREQAEFIHLPIIVITADTSIGPREKALQLGADDFVRKEADPNDFVFRVSKYVRP